MKFIKIEEHSVTYEIRDERDDDVIGEVKKNDFTGNWLFHPRSPVQVGKGKCLKEVAEFLIKLNYSKSCKYCK